MWHEGECQEAFPIKWWKKCGCMQIISQENKDMFITYSTITIVNKIYFLHNFPPGRLEGELHWMLLFCSLNCKFELSIIKHYQTIIKHKYYIHSSKPWLSEKDAGCGRG